MEFDTLQEKIQNFIEKISSREDIFCKDEKLQLSDALFCAGDTYRNRKFYQAIWSAISDIQKNKKNIKVIDAGAWIGILWIFALLHWAEHVTFIEANSVTVKVLKDFLDELWLSERSSVFHADASKVQLDIKADMLISETIAIDFESEDYLNIISHLRKYLHEDSVIIPESFQLDLLSGEKTKKYAFSAYDDVENISLPAEAWDEVSGMCYIYKDISLKSGECISFFNARIIQ